MGDSPEAAERELSEPLVIRVGCGVLLCPSPCVHSYLENSCCGVSTAGIHHGPCGVTFPAQSTKERAYCLSVSS